MNRRALTALPRRRIGAIPGGVLVLLLLAAFALSACSPRVPESTGGETPSESTGEPKAETASVKTEPDADDDGVPDTDDLCPTELENAKWSNGDDGCVDTIDDLMNFAVGDVNQFWSAVFEEQGERYVEPESVTAYSRTIRTGCGASVPDNAFYCGVDNSIYYDADFLESLLDEFGDFSPVFVVAHEWGHLVQAQLGILDQRRRADIQNELQADCFAGAYTQSAESRGLLEEGDVDEGVATALQAGDPRGTAWYEPGAHGTAQQRMQAFQSGYSEGLEACMAI